MTETDVESEPLGVGAPGVGVGAPGVGVHRRAVPVMMALLGLLAGAAGTLVFLLIYVHGQIHTMHSSSLAVSSDELASRVTEWFLQDPSDSIIAYNPEQHTFHAKRRGTYMLYLHMAVRCPGHKQRACRHASLTVSVEGEDWTKLNCSAELPAGQRLVEMHGCMAVVHLQPQERLLTSMEVEGEQRGWRVDKERTRLGLLRVDPEEV